MLGDDGGTGPSWRESRCAVLARAAGEPLPGTAPVGDRWVCVEHAGTWPRSVTAPSDPALALLARRAVAAGRRLLLIRRHGRRTRTDGPRTVLVADTGPGAGRVGRFLVDGPDALAAVPLDGPAGGERVERSLILVCTHGVRDLCCAVDGRALATEIAAADAGLPEPALWECSHLGGHRFAPTALVLPTGYLYGRLDVATALQARKAAGQGEMTVSHCRGRASWAPAGQVAELAVRERTGLRDVDAVLVERIDGETVTVRTVTGERWIVAVRPTEGSARPLSCGAPLERLNAPRATDLRLAGRGLPTPRPPASTMAP